ncbi:hypothetical protein ACFWAY_14710 [Rhodococcus sp. NPDC059968]|uniref:hypothetical protein n=1 Tax=Rhodococcus sp. NPDC059968 TaxID=3347017 RepID=UPI003673349A
MNVETAASYIWWVAAGGALGSLVHYLGVTFVGPRIGARRTQTALTMSACLMLGVVVAAGPYTARYAIIGIGFLSAVCPFTAVMGHLLDMHDRRSFWRALLLYGWYVLAGVCMAIVGYILADVGNIYVEKLAVGTTWPT